MNKQPNTSNSDYYDEEDMQVSHQTGKLKGFSEGLKQGYDKVLDDVEKFLNDKTYLKGATESQKGVHLIRFFPFEWNDFKKQSLAKLSKEKKA